MKKFVVIITIMLLLIFGGVHFLGKFLAKEDLAQCGNYPDESKVKCLPADAIIAVSGGDTQARTAEAVELYKKGWAKKIIFSGAAADKSGPSNAAAMKKQAVAAGISAGNILTEELSENTEQNAVNTSKILAKNNITSAILVTSGYHSRRVAMEFLRAAPSVSFRSHAPSEDRHWSQTWWLTSTGWQLAAQEIAGIINFTAGK